MSKITRVIAKVIKVACYCRVSTDEQKKHGYSIATQISQLKDYVDAHDNMVLVDFYIDEGISAVKVKKRLALQRLLDDVKSGKIDMILFTRLDRWGRDMKIYYQIQDILDKANVSWKAISEDYETETAAGKFKVNIMMSVAQQERDKGSERIKDVFNHKLKNGEALTGAMPFGWMLKEIEGKKKIVRNPEQEEILRDMLNYFKGHQSIRKTIMYADENFEKHPNYNSFYKILQNPFLYGHFRDIDNYCEGYMTKAEFEDLQRILAKNIRSRDTNHTYTFSQIIKCPVCGGNLTGYVSWQKNVDGTKKAHLGYRCETRWFKGKKYCSFSKSKSQLKIEAAVLDNLMPMLDNYIIECEAAEKKVPKKVDVSKIKAEMERLNNMYLKGRISEEDYDKKYIALNKKLKENSTSSETNLKASDELKTLQGINLHELYKTFSQEEKQVFMRGIIKEILIDEDYNIKKIIFL